MLYKANYIEDAVIRIDDKNNRAYVKLLYNLIEYEVSIKSDMVLGNYDYHNIPYDIKKEEYDTFGKSWKFGKSEKEKITL